MSRPLAFIDVETTGLNVNEDRIIDLAIVVRSGNRRISTEFRFNPGIPISPEAAAIHGITDADVADAPRFGSVAHLIAADLETCDLAGFNILRFDAPMLEAEFRRAGVPFSLDDRAIVDVQAIYHRFSTRRLEDAVRLYLGREHEGAHGAMADVLATLEIFEEQRIRHELPSDHAELEEFLKPDGSIDRQGKLAWKGTEAAIAFGKHQGRTLREMARSDAGYLRWILSNDFPRDTKNIVANALSGKFPAPPAAEAEAR